MRGRKANSVVPPLLSSISQGGGGGGGGGGLPEENPPPPRLFISQLRPLATRTPSLGPVGQGVWL